MKLTDEQIRNIVHSAMTPGHVAHPFWEYLFDLLMFWRAPPGTLRARLYDWSYGEPLE